MDQNSKLVDALSDLLFERVTARMKEASGTPNMWAPHGLQGAFNRPGARPELINAMVMPRGIKDLLPARPNVFMQEELGILTGQTASSGTNPTVACGDWKQPGNLKVCYQSYPFGFLGMDTKTINVARMGELTNRAEFYDQRLVGDPFAMSDPGQIIPVNFADAFKYEPAKNLMEAMIDYKREFAKLAWIGDPANTAGSEGYQEFLGFDKLINTGYQDSKTKQLCPAADALVVSYGNVAINTDANAFASRVINIYEYLQETARQTGLDPVEHWLVMRYSTWRNISAVWPCVYATTLCQTSGATTFSLASEQTAMRDGMRNGNFEGRDLGYPYLLIGGKAVRVVIDDTMTETIPVAGQGQGEIAFVPITINGSRPVSYLEYFDFSGPLGITVASQMGVFDPNFFKVMGNGRWLVYPKGPKNTCVQAGMVGRERLILETPFLSARLTGVRYEITAHERGWDTSDTYYFKNGGSYYQTAPYVYPPTA